MSTTTLPIELTPEAVELASERDEKRYELIDGRLREKKVGFKSLLIASLIAERLNAKFFPAEAVAAVEVMVYCFAKKRHGRKPDVVFIRTARLPNGEVPDGDLFVAPDLVVEVMSPSNSAIEMQVKLDEYLEAGVPLVWIVNPEPRTIRVYRADGTTRLYRAGDVIENEPVLPGFRLDVAGVFPVLPSRP